jgi:DNA-binding protein YbaB
MILLLYLAKCQAKTHREVKLSTLTFGARNSMVTIGWKGGTKVENHELLLKKCLIQEDEDGLKDLQSKKTTFKDAIASSNSISTNNP